MCEVKFKIPMSPFGVGSLNVSVAAGIAMFEAMRQRSIAQE
jgi:tRNA G18 (ribose-2'-O)-methylase SpoU